MSDIGDEEMYYDDEEGSQDEGEMDYGEDELVLGEERAAGERSTMRQDDLTVLVEALRRNSTLNTIQNIMWRKALPPSEKFKLIVEAYYRHLESKEAVHARLPVWDELANLIAKVDKVNYRNPLAFLLGVYVSNTSNKRRALEVVQREVLEGVPEVQPQDVLRYSRYVDALKKEK